MSREGEMWETLSQLRGDLNKLQRALYGEGLDRESSGLLMRVGQLERARRAEHTWSVQPLAPPPTREHAYLWAQTPGTRPRHSRGCWCWQAHTRCG